MGERVTAAGAGPGPAAGREWLVERMRAFGTTIFAEMSALAVETQSINLGQGFPDTDGPPELLAAAAEAIQTGHNQYPPGAGVPELRRAITEHQRRHYGLEFDPDTEVLVTTGATEAIAAAVLGICGPGGSAGAGGRAGMADGADEVILFEPYYDSYAACVALGGATRRVVTLRRDGPGWAFDPDELRAAITRNTKAILLNTPHNPTGKVFTRAELESIAALARARDLVVIADEVYEHLSFDGREHVPIATLPGMRERTLTISSASKTYSVTGWKIGWLAGPPHLTNAARTVKQFLTFVSGAPFQPAVAKALDAELPAPRAQLQAQRDLLCAGLAERGFDVIVPEATYFALVDVGEDALAYCRALPYKAGVVAVPASAFYDSASGERYVRFAFCKRPEVLAEALRRLEVLR